MSTAPKSSFFPRWGRRSGRRLVIGCVALAVGAASAMVTLPSSAAPADTPEPSLTAQATSFTISGAGYGHGRGMSQYGAYGAAYQGKSWTQILGFYYPGTKRALQKDKSNIEVWITADDDNDLRVLPAKGLKVSDNRSNTYTLPTGSGYRAWRITRAGDGYRLTRLDTDGNWKTQKTSLGTTTWRFSNSANVVKVWIGGARRELRGSVALVKRGSGGRTVNRLRMEDYLRGVVPEEMPTSWSREAVRAQSVAARSYAARLQSAASSSKGYDLCDTTSCQVYRGLASTRSGRRTIYETKDGNAAIKATARTILKYGKSIVLTEFASSNGGATAASGLAYQVEKKDPYDDVVGSRSWTRKVSAATVARGWSSVGTVERLQVTARDGSGRWGGRVTKIKIVGSKKTITVTGSSFQSRLGLRSTLFHL